MSTKKAVTMAKQNNPVEFASAIEAELASRISTALNDKKIQLAQNIVSQGEVADDQV